MLHISWVHKKFTLHFENEELTYGSSWPKHTPLSTLLDRCALETSVDLPNIKLLSTGETEVVSFWDYFKWQNGDFVMMKDRRCMLADYGIKNNSKIIMLGTNDNAVKRKESVVSSIELDPAKREGLTVMKLSTLLSAAKETLETQVTKLNSDYASYTEKRASHTEPADQLTQLKKDILKSHGMMSEAILQGLLKVDGVVVEEGFENARLKRKELVRYFHMLLDSIDKIKDEIKTIHN